MKKVRSFNEGDQVFAKIKGYPPWPAKVVGKSGKKFKVEFYGTGETGVIRPEDIFYFLKNKEQLTKGAGVKKKEFKDALEEIEKVIEENGGDDGDNGEDDEDEEEEAPPPKRKRGNPPATITKKESEDEDIADEGPSQVKPDPDADKEPEPETTVAQETNNLEVDDDVPFLPNVKIVSENNLKNWIIYADAVKENPDLYKARRVDQRLYFENQVFPVLQPSGKFAGVKLHQSWPLNFSNEYECAMYDNETASRVLMLKESINSGAVTLDTDPDVFLAEFDLTEAEIKRDAEMKQVNSKYKRVERLRNESSLVEMDAKIKNCLGLTKADSKKALELLDQMMQINVDEIMLKKHPHVVEMVRRLRKYIGNVDEWNLSPDELATFNNDAQRIRAKSEEVYKKLKASIQLPAGSPTFFDGFNNVVRKFKEDCIHLNNREVFVLCAEAYSRQAIIERLEQEEELVEAEVPGGPEAETPAAAAGAAPPAQAGKEEKVEQ